MRTENTAGRHKKIRQQIIHTALSKLLLPKYESQAPLYRYISHGPTEIQRF